MKTRVGITIGDIAGIGPEIVARALADKRTWRVCRPQVYAPARVIPQVASSLSIPLEETWFAASRFARVLVRPVGAVRLRRIGCGRAYPELARVAVDCIQAAVRDAMDGRIDAVVTAPVHKRNVRNAGIAFTGHTEFMARITGARHVAMMMHSPRLKVALATTHVPIRELARHLSVSGLCRVIRLFREALRRFGVPDPRIGVASLNPHGAEDGGSEEKEIIALAVRRARRDRVRIDGPHSADALFHHAYMGVYDGVVAMYHDQGLTPVKMVSFDEAVNVTLGLPFVRTSPDHGTAYDIAGTGKANPESMIQAILVAARLAQRKRA